MARISPILSVAIFVGGARKRTFPLPTQACKRGRGSHGNGGTNMTIWKWALPLAAMVALPGCIAKTALDVVTLPVRAGGQAVDWATTSQEESDRNYGRKMRKQEAREGREREKADKERRRQCREAGYRDCG